MSLRLLGGKAKSFSLPTPPSKTRPTQVQLKRRFFDRYQDWSGEVFIDLAAGTGSMGFEAWSRGAEAVYFVEADRVAVGQIKEACERARARYENLGELHSVQSDVLQWLPGFKSLYQSWPLERQELTTVFFDPPYEQHNLYSECLRFFFNGQNQWFQGEFVFESDRQKGPSLEVLKSLYQLQEQFYTQGTSYLCLISCVKQSK